MVPTSLQQLHGQWNSGQQSSRIWPDHEQPSSNWKGLWQRNLCGFTLKLYLVPSTHPLLEAHTLPHPSHQVDCQTLAPSTLSSSRWSSMVPFLPAAHSIIAGHFFSCHCSTLFYPVGLRYSVAWITHWHCCCLAFHCNYWAQHPTTTVWACNSSNLCFSACNQLLIHF